MLMARWSSPIVLHCAQEAPFTSLTDTYRRRVREAAAHQDAEVQLPLLKSQLARVEQEIAKLCSGASSSTPSPTAALVLNEPSGVLHQVIPGITEQEPAFWKSKCGWSFAFCHFTLISVASEAPASTRCRACLARQVGPDSSSDTDC